MYFKNIVISSVEFSHDKCILELLVIVCNGSFLHEYFQEFSHNPMGGGAGGPVACMLILHLWCCRPIWLVCVQLRGLCAPEEDWEGTIGSYLHICPYLVIVMIWGVNQ